MSFIVQMTADPAYNLAPARRYDRLDEAMSTLGVNLAELDRKNVQGLRVRVTDTDSGDVTTIGPSDFPDYPRLFRA